MYNLRGIALGTAWHLAGVATYRYIVHVVGGTLTRARARRLCGTVYCAGAGAYTRTRTKRNRRAWGSNEGVVAYGELLG